MKLTSIAKRLELIPGLIPGRLTNIHEERTTPVGRKLDGEYRESIFRFTFSNEIYSSATKTCETEINEILQKLESNVNIFNEVRDISGVSQLVVAMYIDANSSLSLDPDLLKRISELNIEFSLDLYPPDKGSAEVYASN